MKHAWPAKRGILVERLVKKEGSEKESHNDGLSVLFSLHSPLEDFSPVTYCNSNSEKLKVTLEINNCYLLESSAAPNPSPSTSSSSSSSSTGLPTPPSYGYFINPLVEVLVVLADSAPPLVITYDIITHRHTVWALRPARAEVHTTL